MLENLPMYAVENVKVYRKSTEKSEWLGREVEKKNFVMDVHLKREYNQGYMANAEAAIDAVDKRGFIDRKKVAIGGHSYGAFMTANLLTHSNLFACGIARSGAYNRTLTPFGFQSEQRNCAWMLAIYWQAKIEGVYSDKSDCQAWVAEYGCTC
jgi:dienelactone hydrolase